MRTGSPALKVCKDLFRQWGIEVVGYYEIARAQTERARRRPKLALPPRGAGQWEKKLGLCRVLRA